MSWSCDSCGEGRYEDHTACRQADALVKIVELLEAIHTDNPWRRIAFVLLGALIVSVVLR